MLIKLDHKNKCPPVLDETQIHLAGATVWYVKSQLVELALSSINSFELQTQLHNNGLISAEQVYQVTTFHLKIFPSLFLRDVTESLGKRWL